MKVKIIKSDDEAWYKDHVGKIFAVEKKNGRNGIEYIVLPRDPHGDFYIDGGDCEEVED